MVLHFRSTLIFSGGICIVISKQDMSSDVVVRFIKNCDDPKILDVLDRAVQAVQEVCSTIVWFTEKDCMELNIYEKHAFFVFASFSGKAFEKVVSLGNRVYGAPCILQCLEAREALPKKPHPVYSLAMKGIVVTCTNVVTELRKEVHQKIEWMMGEAMKAMNEKVNCLVAEEVGSKKYLVAGIRKIRIMLPEWVHSVWQDSLYEMVHGSDSRYDKFKCPIFRGFCICASGLTSQERTNIKNVVESQGGKFSGMMKINECTHLIIREPSGQKYQFAKDWSICTVRPNWVFDSVEAGYCLEESKYLLLDGIKSSKTTSTPDHKGKNECNISSISNLSSISVTHINETDFTMRNDIITTKLHPTQSYSGSSLSIFDGIDVRRPLRDGYLDGCKIYLYGPSLENSDKVRILINKGSGTRFNQLNETVSHVVAEVVNNALTQQLMKIPNSPHVVSPLWLLECFKQGICLPENEFNLLQKKPNNQYMSPLVKGSIPANNARTHVKSICNLDNSDANIEIEALCSQYASVSQQSCNRLGESTLMAAAKISEDTKNSTWNKNKVAFEEGNDTMGHGAGKGEAIFAGLTFIIFCPEFVEELTAEIVACSGKVLPLNSRKVANIGVVPIEGCPVTRTVDEVVTIAWVNFCIEESRLVHYDSLEIFRPLTILPNCQPLKECVLSLSGVQSLEKNIIADIIQLLGGRVQDCFVRVRKETFLACTHLVANAPEGPKYEAAVKWGIPIVSKSWVYETARTGRKASEKVYNLKGVNKSIRQVSQSAAIEKIVERSKESVSPHKMKTAATASSNMETVSEIISLKQTEKFTPDIRLRKDSTVPVSCSISYDEQHIGKSDGITRADDVPLKHTKKTSNPRPISGSRVPVQLLASPKNTRVQALISCDKQDDDTPSKFMAGNPYRPHFNFQGSLDGLQSPAVIAKPNKRISLPLEEVFAQNIKIAVKNCTSKSEENNSFSQDCPDSFIHFQQPEKNMPLNGVVISVGKKLIKNQAEYSRLAADLGAECRWSYTNECTHFIFQGKPNDTNREFRSARDQGKFVVSPQWLKACHVQMKRVDETMFPHTFNENMSPVVVGTSIPCTSSRNSPRVSTNLVHQNLSPQRKFSTPPQREEDEATNSAGKGFINDLKKLTEASRTSLKGKQHEIAKSTDKAETGTDMMSPKDVKENEKPGDVQEKQSEPLNQSKPVAKVQASQVEVIWDYPTVRNVDNFAKTDKASTDGSSSYHDLDPSLKSSRQSCIEESKVSSHEKEKVYSFMLSGFKAQEREECASIILSLGGILVDGPCSHLISNILNRSEKFLACVSSGKWILHKSYLTASSKAGHFVKEEDYEWGSETILQNYPNLISQEMRLAISARSWRLKLMNDPEKTGAFSGWRCLLVMNPKKTESFSRLLTAGGAIICSIEDSLETQAVTHAFIELKNASSPVDLEKMVSLGIHCLKPEYISGCLIENSQSEPSSFYIPEVQSALNLKRSSGVDFPPPKLNKSRKLH